MDLVIDQMMQFHHIHAADSHGPVERLTRASVEKNALAGFRKTGLLKKILDFPLRGAIKDGARDINAYGFCGHSKMGLQNLPDIHTRGYPERIQYNVRRTAVRKIGHIFLWQNPG